MVQMTATLDWKPLAGGAHLICVDRDVIWWRLVGDVDYPDVTALFQLSERCAQQYGYTLLLIDGRKGASLTARARRAVAERHRDLPERRNRTVVYGMSALSTGLIALTVRAITLFAKVPPKITICATEQEALAVTAQERATAQPDYKAQG